jgi:hypothetical protein
VVRIALRKGLLAIARWDGGSEDFYQCVDFNERIGGWQQLSEVTCPERRLFGQHSGRRLQTIADYSISYPRGRMNTLTSMPSVGLERSISMALGFFNRCSGS